MTRYATFGLFPAMLLACTGASGLRSDHRADGGNALTGGSGGAGLGGGKGGDCICDYHPAQDAGLGGAMAGTGGITGGTADGPGVCNCPMIPATCPNGYETGPAPCGCLSCAPTPGDPDAGTAREAGSPCSSLDYLKCDGNAVSYCTCTKHGALLGTDLTGSPIYSCDVYSWVDGTACSVACDTTINPTSGCIASAQPVPECAQDGTACWNGNITYCLNGYPVPSTPCTSGTQCTIVPGCGALCLSSSQAVDPRCPVTSGTTGFCADNTAFFCACRYLVGSTVCGVAPHDCSLMGGDYPVCGLPP